MVSSDRPWKALVEHDDGVASGGGAGVLHSVLDGLGAVSEQRGALLVVPGGQRVEPLGHLDVGS
jgi:hypothetical protein